MRWTKLMTAPALCISFVSY